MKTPFIEVKNLSIQFRNDGKITDAVRNVSFNLGQEKLGIVGESGSGKSTVGRALLKLHPRSASINADSMQFKDINILTTTEKQMQKVRGNRISMILQDPKYSLNPVVTVGKQISEAFLIHTNVSQSEAKKRTLEMLNAVKIRDPKRVFNLYPHEISGGMGQRIMIAMMMIPEPEVIIADEPTSALDVSVRLQVLSVLDDLVRDRGLGLIFISHDLNLVRSFCDRVLVMYAGRVVECIAAKDLDKSQHPYTQGLLSSLPSLENRRSRLPVLKRSPDWIY